MPGRFFRRELGDRLALHTYRVGFAYLGNQMGGYGDARVRELTPALRTVLGA